MKNKVIISLLLISFMPGCAFSFDMHGINMINPLDSNSTPFQGVINQPSLELKRGTLTRNAVKNQYTIAMDKFMQTN